MSARELAAEAIGLPRFPVPAATAGEPQVFDLSSHSRARDALAFGLRVKEDGFNVFVVGEDRSGRMTATLAFLARHAAGLPRQPDWVYLNNFRSPHKPKPYRLPAGAGRRLRRRMGELVPALRAALAHAFQAPPHLDALRRLGEGIRARIDAAFAEIKEAAAARGIELRQENGALKVAPRQGLDIAALPESERVALAAGFEALQQKLAAFGTLARAGEAELAEGVRALRRETADAAMAPLLDALEAEFGTVAGLARWLVELRGDLLDHVDQLAAHDSEAPAGKLAPVDERWAVNLFVDHTDEPHPQVVIEANPTYENLFGRIEYRATGGVLDTHFTLIRPGALHRANGGILVLRAEAIAQQDKVWTFLKAALRDRCIRIEEPHREHGAPMASAPRPKPVPLSVKIVLVGPPRWFYTFFAADPEFPTYFKVKADIDPDMPADAGNLAVYAGLVRGMARRFGREAEDDAVALLLGLTARWAGDRRKLSARFEMVEDVVAEAADAAARDGGRIDAEDVRAAILARRRRNARAEDRTHESIRDGLVLIDIAGTRVGQVNALTVRELGDHAYGLPSRVSARVAAGRLGLVNIERMTELGGPIQQKGVLIIEGFLNGRFGRDYPLSITASLTFEQNYGGVEGDSASLAELAAILSALAETPLRQDIALTGSVNQSGEVQAVGGVHHKIEGFHRACALRGLSGSQGVIVPAANEISLTVRDEVAADIAAGRFHVWSVAGVDEAMALLAGIDPGVPDARGRFPAASLSGRVQASLDRFDAVSRRRRE